MQQDCREQSKPMRSRRTTAMEGGSAENAGAIFCPTPYKQKPAIRRVSVLPQRGRRKAKVCLFMHAQLVTPAWEDAISIAWE